MKLADIPLSCPVLRRLAALKRVVERLAAVTGAEWVGIYRKIVAPDEAQPSSEDEMALVKEAYVGSPSRAFFPLTKEFAAGSNNSTVAMSGDTVIIHDVQSMPSDLPYYNCDKQVRSEVCAPIIEPVSGECIGIIDCEAWRPYHFSELRIAAILDTCEQLGQAGMLLNML